MNCKRLYISLHCFLSFYVILIHYSCNSFKVIDSANSDFEVSIKEALHIKHKNPSLNKQLSTNGMSFILKIFT